MKIFGWTLITGRAALLMSFLLFISSYSLAQTAGQVMFVGFNADGSDGFAFVTFVDLADGTTIYFRDSEWNGNPIGGGGAFVGGEGSITWSNNTGSTIPAGTVLIVENSASATPTVNIGSVSRSGAFDVGAGNEVLYMFLGADASTPTVFLSAIANDGFGANGTLTNTGLTAGVNATSITGDEDVMVYTGNTNCTSTIADCALEIANATNWTTADGMGDQSTGFFPDDVPCVFYGVALGQTTYYSRNVTSGGNWDDPNSWTTNSDGSGGPLAAGVWPKRHDNVVILNGHNITINNIADNMACGISPDGLGRSNVGPFVSSNIAMFYQTGDIEIGGTLTVSGIEMMTEGYTHVLAGGSFILGSNLVNLGYLEADATSTLTCLDDLVLTGNSITIINTNSTSTDDLIIDYTNATLCGSGTATLQNGAGSQVTYTNGATQAQICTTFTINCIGAGCSGFPVVGTGTAVGNAGPGGVGQAASNSMWYMANFGTFTDVGVTPATNGQQIRQWNDRSGNNRHATQATAGNRPLLHTNGANGYPALRFTGNLFIDGPSPGMASTSSYTYLIVFRDTLGAGVGLGGTNDGAGHFILDRTAVTNELVSLKPVTGNRYFYQKRNNAGGGLGGITGTTAINTNTKIIQMRRNYNVNYQMFYNNAQEGGNLADADGATTPPGPRIGRHTNTTNGGLRGYINEFIVYNYAINAAQRIIINNYLSAKYGISLGADDVYSMDDPGNGNYDHEVAGIGQATDGSSHRDAKGTGMVRMTVAGPTLANNEWLLWGHDNASLTSNFADIGAPILERLNRVWRISETGDVGNVTISFDISGLSGSPIGSNLRLLIDRDGDGFSDNDVTPISGGVIAGGIISFSGINFQNGDRFTLGNTDLSAPLPIELKTFYAEARGQMVHLFWSTASETNNDYFTVERSKTGGEWEQVLQVDGAGTATSTKNYSAVDDGPFAGLSYYRLKQTDFDGTYTYSKVVSVTLEPRGELEVFPNPSNGLFTVRSPFQFNQVQLLDQLGRNAHIRVEPINNREATIDGTQNTPGLYFLQVSDGHVVKTVRIIIR